MDREFCGYVNLNIFNIWHKGLFALFFLRFDFGGEGKGEKEVL